MEIHKIKKKIFFVLTFCLIFIFLELLSSFVLLKKYSSQKLIYDLKPKNSHFIHLSLKILEKSLKKLNLKKNIAQKTFYDNLFFDPIKVIDDPKWKKVFENLFNDNIKSIKKQLITFENLRYNYRTPTLDYVYTYPNKKLSDYEKEIINFKSYQRKSFQNNSKLECWIFGGSTVFGDRLKNNQTITSQLNKIQNKYNFINYGQPGYNSNLQLRYLIELLKIKKNNLPYCVIFFDGMNDSLSSMKLPLVHPAFRSADPNLIFKIKEDKNLKFNKEYLPFGKNYNTKLDNLLKYNQNELSKQTSAIKNEMRENKFKINDEDVMTRLSVDNYIQNGQIAKGILSEINKDIIFIRFLQPNGSLDYKNPFVKKKFFDSNIYQLSNNFYKNIKKHYKDEYIDLSNLSESCKINCYVDEGHYSISFNKIISNYIIEQIKKY